MAISNVLSELYLFSNKALTLCAPTEITKVNGIERAYSISFPDEYKEFLQIHNGLSLMGVMVLGIGANCLGISLEEVYRREHEDVENVMPGHLVPFSPDGAGNYYCFDILDTTPQSCNIVFWQHDYLYSEADLPEVTNTSFSGWLREVLIEWISEDYNYDGSRR